MNFGCINIIRMIQLGVVSIAQARHLHYKLDCDYAIGAEDHEHAFVHDTIRRSEHNLGLCNSPV